MNYEAVVWWVKTEQTGAKTILTKAMTLVSLCITGAIITTPTAAMVQARLSPIDLLIMTEARKAAYRLKCSGF